MVFGGFVISSAIIPLVADRFGRKRVFIATRLIMGTANLIMVIIPGGAGNYAGCYGLLLCNFVIGISDYVNYSVGFMYFCEFSTPLSGKTFATLLNM